MYSLRTSLFDLFYYCLQNPAEFVRQPIFTDEHVPRDPNVSVQTEMGFAENEDIRCLQADHQTSTDSDVSIDENVLVRLQHFFLHFCQCLACVCF